MMRNISNDVRGLQRAVGGTNYYTGCFLCLALKINLSDEMPFS